MADWARRNPQGQGASIQGGPEAAASTTAVADIILDTATLQSDIDSAAPVTTVILPTTPGANNDGLMQTSIDTALPTEAVFTTPSSTTRALVTDPPEAARAQSGSSSGELSKGAVAGIAIGTCLVGAVIAFISAWLLFKRRDKKFIQKTCPSGYPIYADSSPELVMVQKNAAAGGPYVQIAQTHMRTPIPLPSRVPATGDPLADVLPPTASDHDVQNRLSALFGQVHRHVDTYYRDVHASITPSMDSDLASFGKDVDMLELLQSCSQPTVALKHALVAFVLNITSPKQLGNEQTLWPEELAQTLRTNDTDSTTLATARALHRRLSVYLYTQQNILSPTKSQSRLSNLSSLSLTRRTTSAIREAAEHFSLTFFPWANPTFGDQERESDLAGTITEALECRIWLLGQIKEWAFEWEEPGRGVVVLKPAVVVREAGGPRRVVVVQSVAGI